MNTNTCLNRNKYLIGKIGLVLCGALLGYAAHGQPSVSLGVSVQISAASDFYEPLTPYGEWVVVGSYGRCWHPARVEANWRPYCNGYWQRTEGGWYWVSDEPWAWATYHYGRWNLSPEVGWYWVPQTQWAPAWVSWHTGGGYIGWAPLYPSGVNVISPQAYVFVPERRFTEPVRPSTVVVNTTVIMQQTVNNQAPAPAYIERASGRTVQSLPVQQLRQQTEAGVVAKQRTPAATSVQPAVRSQVQPAATRAVAPRAPSPVVNPAVAPQATPAPVPKAGKAPSAAGANPVPRSEARPAGAPPVTEKQPVQQRSEQQVKPVKSAEPNPAQPARERPAAGGKQDANPVDQNHESRGKE